MRFVTPVLLVFIFAGAARLRFLSFPLAPIFGRDSWGYGGPAISVFIRGHFEQSHRSFPYPGFLYLVLRQFQDFNGIVILQCSIGLLGGLVLWLAWQKLKHFFPQRPGVSIAHAILGLLMMIGYLWSISYIVLEHTIRPESIFPALSAFQLWISLVFVEEAFVKKRLWPMLFAGFFMAFQGMYFYVFKPQWGLAVIAALLPLGAAVLFGRWAKWFLSLTLIPAGLGFVLLFWLPEKHLNERYRPQALSFLDTTLFCIHAKYIYPELMNDAHSPETAGYDKRFLEKVAGDVKEAFDSAPKSNIYPSLGFDPDTIQHHSDTISQIASYFNNSDKCSGFFIHYYLQAWLHHPVGMFTKIVRELGLFYRVNSNVTQTMTSRVSITKSFKESVPLIEGSNIANRQYEWPPLDRYVESLRKLGDADSYIRQNVLISVLHKAINYTYLAALITIVLFAIRARQSQAFHKASGRFVISPFPLIFWLFSFNFGMTLTTAIVHSMKIARYTEFQITFTMFSYFSAMLVIIAMSLEYFKPLGELPGSHSTKSGNPVGESAKGGD